MKAILEILFSFGLVKLVRETAFPGAGTTRRDDGSPVEPTGTEAHLIDQARMRMDRGEYDRALAIFDPEKTGSAVIAKMTLYYEVFDDGKGGIVETRHMPPLASDNVNA